MVSFKKKAHYLLKVTKQIYTPVSIIFILYFSYIHRELLAQLLDMADWSQLLLAVVLWYFLHFLTPLSPSIFLRLFSKTIPYFDLLKIHLSVLPAKYLPGGVWHTVGRLSAYHSHGVEKRELGIFAVIETLFPCIITLFLGGVLLMISARPVLDSLAIGPVTSINFLLLVLIPIFVRWKFPNYWLNRFLQRYFLLVSLSILFWITAAASFLAYFSSFTVGNNPLSSLHVIGVYIYSWGIGYISIFAPQGIGVFEAVAGNLLSLPLSFGGAVAFLAGFRLLILVADILAWLTFISYCIFLKHGKLDTVK